MMDRKTVFWLILLIGGILLLIEANSYFFEEVFDIEFLILSLTLLLLSLCIKQNNHKAIYFTLLSGGILELFVGLLASGLPVVGVGYASEFFVRPITFSLIMIVTAFWYKIKFMKGNIESKKW